MNKKLKKTAFSISAFLVVITIVTTIVSNVCIKLSEYTIKLSGLSRNAKVVVISDLHGKEYGKENKRLLDKISEQQPDAIFVVGDMLDDRDVESGFSKTQNLLFTLLDIAEIVKMKKNINKHLNCYSRILIVCQMAGLEKI